MLKKLNKEDFAAVFQIMDSSFPEDERRSEEEQKKLLDKPEYTIYGITDQNILIGFLSVWDLSEFIYIEHFAISRNYRNGGRGRDFLNSLLSTVSKKIVLEVEPPETELTKRRIGFYQRNGFFYNDYNYMQLAYSPEKAPVPLKLMTFPEAISAREFEKIRDCIYKEIFGVEK